MSETKQSHAKKLTETFSTHQVTNIINSGSQMSEEFPLDLINKTYSYIPVICINPDSSELVNSIEINSQNFLSKSDNNDEPEKKLFLNPDLLQELLKSPFGNKQSGNILKFEVKKKTRLLVKRGVARISLLLADIALLYSRDKLSYVIASNSKRYSIDKTLTELDEELDHSIFFRANRQYIVNINFIKSFKAYQKVKLLLDINVTELEEPLIISQEVAPAFKKWIKDA